LAARILEAIGVDPELIPGSGGIYDISRDGALVFSKHEQGRFPEEDEVLALLR